MRSQIVRQQLLRRPGMTFAFDQVVYSLSNFLVVLVAARASSRADFGAFSVVYGIVITGATLRSAALGDVVLVTVRDDGLAASLGAGCSLLFGLGLGAVAVTTGVILGAPPEAIVVGAASPFVLVQDSMRSAAFAARAPGTALGLDLLWLLVQVAVIAFLGLRSGAGGIGWAVGALGAAAYGWRLVRPTLNPRLCIAWLRSNRHLAGPYALQYGLTSGVTQLFGFLVAATGSLSGAGALRGAQTLLGPFSICMGADRVDLITRIRHGVSVAGLRRRLTQSRVLLTAVAAAVAVTVIAIPDGVGAGILGHTWHSAAVITPFLAGQFALLGLAQGPQVRLVVGLHAKASLAIKVATAALSLVAFGVMAALNVEPLDAAVAALVASAFLNLVISQIAAGRLAPLDDLVNGFQDGRPIEIG